MQSKAPTGSGEHHTDYPPARTDTRLTTVTACCSWEEAQRARVACIDKYRSAKGQEQKKGLLRDVLVLAFHTLQPVSCHALCFTSQRVCRARAGALTTPPRVLAQPDRVGVVRRMRIGVSLYKKEGESTWTVDLSSLRHKTRYITPPMHSTPRTLPTLYSVSLPAVASMGQQFILSRSPSSHGSRSGLRSPSSTCRQRSRTCSASRRTGSVATAPAAGLHL